MAGRPAGDDQSSGGEIAFAGLHGNILAFDGDAVELGHPGLHAELGGLLVHHLGQVHAADPVGEPRVVLDHLGIHDIAADDVFFEEECFKPGAGGINPGG